MPKKITIEELVGMTQRGLHDVETRLECEIKTLRQDMKEGFQTVLSELHGLRDDLKIERQARRIEHTELSERVERLEQDVETIKHKVNI